jgi:hypothetical protein
MRELQGEFELGRSYIEHALAVAERSGQVDRIVFTLGTRGELSYYAGDWEGAQADWERAASLAHAISETLNTHYFPALALGVLLVAQGRKRAT